MSHYAKIENGIVTQVIVAEQDFIDFISKNNDTWIQTSYNTRGGIYYYPNSNEPSEDQSYALRKNFASIGFSYDSNIDAFIPPKPFNSWTLNEDTCLWQSPIPYPSDDKNYIWNEELLNWEEVIIEQ